MWTYGGVSSIVACVQAKRMPAALKLRHVRVPTGFVRYKTYRVTREKGSAVLICKTMAACCPMLETSGSSQQHRYADAIVGEMDGMRREQKG